MVHNLLNFFTLLCRHVLFDLKIVINTGTETLGILKLSRCSLDIELFWWEIIIAKSKNVFWSILQA